MFTEVFVILVILVILAIVYFKVDEWWAKSVTLLFFLFEFIVLLALWYVLGNGFSASAILDFNFWVLLAIAVLIMSFIMISLVGGSFKAMFKESSSMWNKGNEKK